MKSARRPRTKRGLARLAPVHLIEALRIGLKIIEHPFHRLGRSTVKRILEDHGICPEPTKTTKTSWNDFIRSHMDVLAATDFFSVELLTPKGLVRCFVLFVIDIATRKVPIAGIRAEPNGEWMKQVARNLTHTDDGFLQGKRYLIHDRDPLFTKAFDETLEAGGTKAIKTVKQSPNLNAFAERFVQSIKQECLDRMILTSQRQLEYAVEQHLIYYHRDRDLLEVVQLECKNLFHPESVT